MTRLHRTQQALAHIRAVAENTFRLGGTSGRPRRRKGRVVVGNGRAESPPHPAAAPSISGVEAALSSRRAAWRKEEMISTFPNSSVLDGLYKESQRQLYLVR